MLRLLRRDKNVYQFVRVDGMTVRSLTPVSVVVTGIATETGTTADGKKFKSSHRFIDTWKLRQKRWQCVASKAAKVPAR